MRNKGQGQRGFKKTENGPKEKDTDFYKAVSDQIINKFKAGDERVMHVWWLFFPHP